MIRHLRVRFYDPDGNEIDDVIVYRFSEASPSAGPLEQSLTIPARATMMTLAEEPAR